MTAGLTPEHDVEGGSGHDPAPPKDRRRGVVTRPDILLASDIARDRHVLRTWLDGAGYRVALAGDVNEALEATRQLGPSVVVVDLGPAAFNLLYDERHRSAIPIVILDRDEEAYLVAALDAGADDYVAKPPRRGELLARIRAVLRRSRRSAPEQVGPIVTADFTLDLASRRVASREGEIHLTPVQWRLVEILARHPDQLVSQRDLLTGTWGPSKVSHTHYLRVHMHAIRAKLEHDPSHPRYFRTEVGSGIRFCPSGKSPPPRAAPRQRRAS
jgi:two-component system KDP operon response regulator KdpE